MTDSTTPMYTEMPADPTAVDGATRGCATLITGAPVGDGTTGHDAVREDGSC